jgi:uroporphyrinogen-III decarboxylase
MTSLTSHERLLRTIEGRPVDRIPIRSPLNWNPLEPEPEPGSWQDACNYRLVRDLVAESCDFLVNICVPEAHEADTAGQKGYERLTGGIFERRFFLIPPEYVHVAEQGLHDQRRYTTYLIRTPKGELRTTDEEDPEIDTTWNTEPLIKDLEDAERILSVPYCFESPDPTPFLSCRDRLGNRGLASIFISSPITHISRMMHFETFLEWTVSERDLIHRMLAVITERIAERLSWALDHGIGPVFHFGGMEQATPPMMSNRLFDEMVVGYEGELSRMVRDRGGIVHVHCHGRVGTVLERIIEMGAHMLDPLEPPPAGDIDLAEARRRVAGRLVLIGNIEWSDFEHRSPDDIEELVCRAIEAGGPDRFILAASDETISAVSDRLRENLVRFVEAGIRYGKRSLKRSDDHGCVRT